MISHIGLGLLLLVFSYLLGAIPFGYLIVRWSQGTDVRRSGSGNIGATNVLRTTGHWAGILTLMLDAFKGFGAVFATGLVTHQDGRYMALAAVSAVVGHVFPIYLRFKGGKGVATAAGVFLTLAPVPLLASVAIFIVIVAVWRTVSLGSILGSCSFCFLFFLLSYRGGYSSWILLASVFCSCLIIIRHKENIKRLVAGTESRFPGKK